MEKNECESNKEVVWSVDDVDDDVVAVVWLCPVVVVVVVVEPDVG